MSIYLQFPKQSCKEKLANKQSEYHKLKISWEKSELQIKL